MVDLSTSKIKELFNKQVKELTKKTVTGSFDYQFSDRWIESYAQPFTAMEFFKVQIAQTPPPGRNAQGGFFSLLNKICLKRASADFFFKNYNKN